MRLDADTECAQALAQLSDGFRQYAEALTLCADEADTYLRALTLGDDLQFTRESYQRFRDLAKDGFETIVKPALGELREAYAARAQEVAKNEERAA